MKIKFEVKLPESDDFDLRWLLGMITVAIGITLFGLLVAGLAALFLLVDSLIVAGLVSIFLGILIIGGGAYVGEKLYTPYRKS